MTELDANRVPGHTGRDIDNAAPTEAASQRKQQVDASGRQDGQPDQPNSKEQCVAIHGAAAHVVFA